MPSDRLTYDEYLATFDPRALAVAQTVQANGILDSEPGVGNRPTFPALVRSQVPRVNAAQKGWESTDPADIGSYRLEKVNMLPWDEAHVSIICKDCRENRDSMGWTADYHQRNGEIVPLLIGAARAAPWQDIAGGPTFERNQERRYAVLLDSVDTPEEVPMWCPEGHGFRFVKVQVVREKHEKHRSNPPARRSPFVGEDSHRHEFHAPVSIFV
jgi:hypothetical protein